MIRNIVVFIIQSHRLIEEFGWIVHFNVHHVHPSYVLKSKKSYPDHCKAKNIYKSTHEKNALSTDQVHIFQSIHN